MKTFLFFIVRLYRIILGPLIGPCCRFSPSCSAYAEEAFRRKGLFAGAKLAAARILKCHPFHPGGYDPVP